MLFDANFALRSDTPMWGCANIFGPNTLKDRYIVMTGEVQPGIRCHEIRVSVVTVGEEIAIEAFGLGDGITRGLLARSTGSGHFQFLTLSSPHGLVFIYNPKLGLYHLTASGSMVVSLYGMYLGLAAPSESRYTMLYDSDDNLMGNTMIWACTGMDPGNLKRRMTFVVAYGNPSDRECVKLRLKVLRMSGNTWIRSPFIAQSYVQSIFTPTP